MEFINNYVPLFYGDQSFNVKFLLNLLLKRLRFIFCLTIFEC